MKVLVTGGAGFIGSHIVEHFAGEPDAEVVVLDNLATGKRENLAPGGCAFVEGSIEDLDLLRSCCREVDYVFHLAAMVSVPMSMERPWQCVRTNVDGTLNVMKAAAENGVRKVIFSSSCAVYGEPQTLPVSEAHPVDPMSPYALTKLDGEVYMRILTETWGIPCSVMRYFNVYGPRQNPASQYAAAIPIFISRALRGEDLLIYGDGSQTRDFVFVKDVVAANLNMMTHGPGPFNVGTGESLPIRELAETIVRETGSSSKIVHVDARPGEVLHSCADASRLRAEGWQPSTSLSEGLRATMAAMQA